MDKEQIIKTTKKWVETVVIDLNLCPFAQREIINNTVRFTVSESTNEEQLLLKLYEELTLIQNDSDIETSFVIHPYVLNKFKEFNQFLLLVDHLLEQMQLTSFFQVASFHPRYQFEGLDPNDVQNYTNRSPYPMLHILRESSLDMAIDQHPDTSKIPIRNNKLMQEIGIKKMKELLLNSFKD